MELDQFRDMALEGVVVECCTAQERRNVLELFEELGFKISSVSRQHLLMEPEKDDDTMYAHPGFNPCKQCVSCYRNFERAKDDMQHAVSYDDVRNLIENPSPLDSRSAAEFANDFASLLR